MFVGAPLVKTKQDRSVRVHDLPKVGMTGSRWRQAKQRLVPLETGGHVRHADDGPRALHESSCGVCLAAAEQGRKLSKSARSMRSSGNIVSNTGDARSETMQQSLQP